MNHIGNKILEFINVCNEQRILNIIEAENFKMMDQFLQHGTTSVMWHSIAVAYYCFRFSQIFKINCDIKSLISGVLLHDYFLYDWHNKEKSGHLHGFRHPKIALKNAERDFDLNKIEKDIIERHMFPLTLIPPKYKESIIICIVDKYLSIIETLRLQEYSELKKAVLLYLK